MVFCVVALPVLLVLSVFSAKYRALTREAIACVLKMASFRPCEMDTDQKLKKKVFGGLIKINKNLA